VHFGYTNDIVLSWYVIFAMERSMLLTWIIGARIIGTIIVAISSVSAIALKDIVWSS
jgi:hypothetical protein